MKIDRRDFVFSLAALAGAPPAVLAGKLARQKAGSIPPLSDAEKNTLGAICERIVPADEYPGARELGAVHFIDRLLREAHPAWTLVYRAGLASTDVSSRKLYGKPFAALDTARQDELLRKMERSELPVTDWVGFESGTFFTMVRTHTMHGCYSHPKWGGNRNKAAWKMIGFDDWWA